MRIVITVTKEGAGAQDKYTFNAILPAGVELMPYAKQYVTDQNANKMAFERRYVLAGAAQYRTPDPSLKRNHDWQPCSLVTAKDTVGIYQRMHCVKCGITARQYQGELYFEPSREPTFAHEDYADCVKSGNRQSRKKGR